MIIVLLLVVVLIGTAFGPIMISFWVFVLRRWDDEVATQFDGSNCHDMFCK